MQMSEQQKKEWADNPTNEYLVDLIEKYVLYLDHTKGLEAYHPGEPQKTQELLAALNGEASAWGEAIEVLKGNFDIMEEVVNEYIRDLPKR